MNIEKVEKLIVNLHYEKEYVTHIGDLKLALTLREKCPSKYGVFCGSYFPVFGVNTEIYSVNLHIQSENGKTYGPEIFGHFSRSENHGLVLRKERRVIEFSQKVCFKSYIDMNTELRKKAKNHLEKLFSSWWSI